MGSSSSSESCCMTSLLRFWALVNDVDDKAGTTVAAKHQAATGELANDEEDKDKYHPSHYIGSLAASKTSILRRGTNGQELEPAVATVKKSKRGRPAKTRFGLLSTPEKRRVFEIPSSQSPLESPLYTQVTPQKSDRRPLYVRSTNTVRTQDTPSKRKRVTFHEPTKEQILPPPSVRKFASVIQDSEEEDEGGIENSDEDFSGQYINFTSHTMIRGSNGHAAGVSIGKETQAMLLSIDRACANVEDDAAWAKREPSVELGEPLSRQNYEESQEVREQVRLEGMQEDMVEMRSQSPTYYPPHVGIKQEASDGIHENALPLLSSPPSHQKSRASPSGDDEASSVTTPQQPRVEFPVSTPQQEDIEPHDMLPSTPMIIRDESSDKEEEPGPTPPHSTSVPAPTLCLNPQEELENLNDEQPVQVSRSPSARPQTQQSYSSKAEQQLQSEYQTYSQHRTGVPASSMHVAYESGFSYQATPFPPQPLLQERHPSHLSQATTVEPTQISPYATPRRAKPQPVRSVTTTPRENPSSQPFISPNRPPPLVIPSSFPSPCRTVMEGWSSPVMGRMVHGNGKGHSQWGGSTSIENFSIPAPPPLEDDDDDDDDEDEEEEGEEEEEL